MVDQEIISLPGVSDLLKRSWQIYRERFWVFLGIIILPLLVILPLILIGGGLFLLRGAGLPILIGIVIFLILVLIAIVVGLWARVALLYAIKDREQKVGIRESFARGWPKIISFFWVSLLVGFITLIGVLLFIIPGIIFAVWFSLATYVLVAEDLTGMKALSKSKKLVSGYWWKVFWRFLVLGIIGLILVPPSAFIEEFTNIPKIISPIFSILFTPFVTTYIFLIYEDLRKLKEEFSF